MASFYETIKTKVDAYTNDCHRRHDMNLLNIYFRGQGREDWSLVPKIRRKDVQISETESKIVAINRGLWRLESSLFENIARMQHYGLPTRFLDYTTDVDVALFFACNDSTHYDSDGALFICKYDTRNAQHIDTCLISELFALENEITVQRFSEQLIDKYEGPNKDCLDANDLGIRLLSWIDHGFMVTPSESELDRLRTWNHRLINQRGVFFVFGNKLKSPNLPRSTSWANAHIILPEIADTPSIIQHPDYIQQILIPKEAKPEIIKTLAERGITKAFLFPDNYCFDTNQLVDTL